MKIHDIVVEGRNRKPLRRSARLALPNLTQYDILDNNSNPYLAYRFGVAMATSPEGDMDKKGPIGSNFNTIDYSDADAEIRRGAEKIMGIKSSRSTGKGSEEMSQINKNSPIPAKKPNKYGI